MGVLEAARLIVGTNSLPSAERGRASQFADFQPLWTSIKPRHVGGQCFKKRLPKLVASSSRQVVRQDSEVELAKCDLREALARLDRGLVTSDRGAQEKLNKAIAALEATQKDTQTTDHELLSATWRLLWTTEKETLFILKWAPLFGTKAGEVFQPINVQENSLSNVITFLPDGAFVVASSIQVVFPKRVAFQFNKATLKLPGRKIGLPPYGQGWFDNVYIDEDLRISKDSRGDTLITEAVPADTGTLQAALS